MKTKAHHIATLVGIITLAGAGPRLAAEEAQPRPGPEAAPREAREMEGVRREAMMAIRAEQAKKKVREVEARRPAARRMERAEEVRRRTTAVRGGPVDGSPPGPEKIEHLQQAARHLEAAGFREQSERVRKVVAEMTAAQHAREMRMKQLRDKKPVPGADRPDGPPPFVAETHRELGKLHAEVQELRQALRKLNAKVDAQAKPEKMKRPAKKEKKRDKKEG